MSRAVRKEWEKIMGTYLAELHRLHGRPLEVMAQRVAKCADCARRCPGILHCGVLEDELIELKGDRKQSD